MPVSAIFSIGSLTRRRSATASSIMTGRSPWWRNGTRTGGVELLGVGRLVADPDHENVEYAVLVGDKWQNKGLGSVLTEAAMDIASRWGLKRVVAQTGSDNARMLTLFNRHGFAATSSPDGSVIDLVKELQPG